jgi:hypothetical protein
VADACAKRLSLHRELHLSAKALSGERSHAQRPG